jgi:hypothetical protein
VSDWNYLNRAGAKPTDYRATSNLHQSRAGYLRYQLAEKFALAGRGEYMSDRGGIFSGLNQALKETTLTADYQLADGFLVRGEWRRDFSNQLFFLTTAPGVLKQD